MTIAPAVDTIVGEDAELPCRNNQWRDAEGEAEQQRQQRTMDSTMDCGTLVQISQRGRGKQVVVNVGFNVG